MPKYSKNPRGDPRSEVTPLQAFVATRNQSRPRPGTHPEGGIITGGHLHHPDCHHDEEGVVHPRGWGFVPVAMCLISLSLSLSRVLEMAWSWCIMGFVNIVGSYGVFPSLSCCDELSFPFEISFYRIEYFYGFENTLCMPCYEYPWWKWGIVLIHLIYILALNLQIPRWH